MDMALGIIQSIFSTTALIALLKIIAIDIILSGDNAIVIAMATRKLPKEQQNKAILWGTTGAVVLRVLFAALIVWLLKIPYVNLIGGVLLVWIAYKVLVGGEREEEATVASQSGLLKAIGTIVLADGIMSLDNVVAVAGAANGHIFMLIIGVAISIPIMIFGSKLIVKVMERHVWISYVGAGILAWTAGEMLLKDKHLDQLLGIDGTIEYIFHALLTVLILCLGYLVNKKRQR